MSLKSSGRLSRPSKIRFGWNAWFVIGACATTPPASCVFCARTAAIRSAGLRPNDATRSGSSQMRIEYSRAPSALMSPTPSIRLSTSATLRIA